MAQNQAENLRKITQETQQRVISLRTQKPKIDDENRTVELAFSSETPVNRWFGKEVLEHTPGAIDGSRFDAGLAPLLLNHDRNQLIGTVESWRLDADNITRATVKFSPHSELARQIFSEVKDGFRTGVSFGYRILDGAFAKRDGEEIFLASRWLPVEISIEAIPADGTVGVGRSLRDEQPAAGEPKETASEAEEQRATEAPQTPAAETPAAVETRTNTEVRVMEENQTVTAIMDFARAVGEEALGKEFAVNGRSIEELRTAIQNKLKDAGKSTDVTPGSPVDGVPATQIGLSRKETEQYSLLRALNGALDGNWNKAGLERAAHDEICKRLGREPENGGFFVPYESQTRDLSVAGGQATGGALVATDYKPESFIEMLRNKSVMYRLGAQQLTGLRGNIAIPRQTGASIAYWVTEGQAPAESQPAFGQIGMSPKTLGNVVEFTRKLILQSNPSIERLVYNDIAKVMALGIDSALIVGDGVDKPLGILNVTNVNPSVSTGSGTPATVTNEDIVMMEAALEEANIDAATLNYLSRSGLRAKLKTRPIVAGQPVFINSSTNQMNGYGYAASMQIPANKLILGDFSQIVVGEWGVLEIVPNALGAGFRAGNVEIRALQSVDACVRYETAFTVNADAR